MMMAKDTGSNTKRSPAYGALQQVVDSLFSEDDAPYMEFVDEAEAFHVSKLDVVLAAEAADLPEDLLRIVRFIPSGEYTRTRLTNQLNSALCGHAWGQVYGTVS